MDGIPIIKIEIEGMKERIGQALMIRNGEFDKMIGEAVKKSFTIETIQYKIDMQVAKALDNAIDSLSEHYIIKTIIQDIVVKSLVKVRDKIEEEK